MDQLTLIPDTTTPTEIRLAEHAEVIRALGKRVVHDVLEIGRRLSDAKEIAGHGNWLPWLEREFGWSEDTAENYIAVHQRVGPLLNSEHSRNLSLPMQSLRLLAAKSTPEEVREAVIEKAESGEHLSLDDVKRMIEEARAKDKDAHAEAMKKQHDAAQKQLEKAQKDHDEQVAAIKKDFENAALTPEELKETIEQAVEPLQKKIDKYKKQLEKLKEREKTKGPEDEFGLRAQAIASAMQRLSDVLVITPAQVIKAQELISGITGQSMQSGLAMEIKQAKQVSEWVKKFIAATRRFK